MTREEVIIRRARNDDFDSIIDVLKSTKLAGETWKSNEVWTRMALQETLSCRNYTILVAQCGSAIVGFIDCLVYPSFWEGERQGIMNHLFVQDAYQGNGVGTKLVRAVLQHAEAEDIGELHVSTEQGNAKARRFYGKHNFTEEQLLLERSREAKKASS